MALDKYQEKRNLSKSSEPYGTKNSGNGKPLFVIQKHDSSNLHYDFRLEIDGDLKSWAVPKGLSTDPSEKRLGVRTEDHPMDYADFEGVIPEDQYGGGTVMIWDKGSFENMREQKEEDNTSLKESLDEGKIEVWLTGEKLSGGFVLIRTKSGHNEQWLIKKMKDDEADARRNPVSTEPESVKTGRSLSEIEKEESDD